MLNKLRKNKEKLIKYQLAYYELLKDHINNSSDIQYVSGCSLKKCADYKKLWLEAVKDLKITPNT